MIDESALVAKLNEIQHTVQGLSREVELWRVHTSTTGDFILREIEELLNSVKALKTKLQT